MSFKPSIKVYGEAPYYTNGQTFATKEEAEKSARNRHWNWTQAEAWATEESDEPVNYKWVDGVGDVRIEDEPKTKTRDEMLAESNDNYKCPACGIDCTAVTCGSGEYIEE